MKITYRDLPTWKYQLLKDWTVDTEIYGFNAEDNSGMWELFKDGSLHVSRGYAWDGPSGPTFDTKSFMRGSVVHDVLYQAIRLGLLPSSFRKQADVELIKLCKEDGMSWSRRKYVYRSLRLFGGRAAKPKKWETKTAP